METFEDRLRAFLYDPRELPQAIIISAQQVEPGKLTYEINLAKEHKCENLIFLSTHAFIQAFMQSAFNKTGEKATKLFLEKFMDDTQDRKFSDISEKIHNLRNIMAHTIFSTEYYKVKFDYSIQHGFKKDHGGKTHINPKIYAEQFIDSLTGARLQRWACHLSPEQRIKHQFLSIRKYLNLKKKTDPIVVEIDGLQKLKSLGDVRKQANKVYALIKKRYNL